MKRMWLFFAGFWLLILGCFWAVFTAGLGLFWCWFWAAEKGKRGRGFGTLDEERERFYQMR